MTLEIRKGIIALVTVEAVEVVAGVDQVLIQCHPIVEPAVALLTAPLVVSPTIEVAHRGVLCERRTDRWSEGRPGREEMARGKRERNRPRKVEFYIGHSIRQPDPDTALALYSTLGRTFQSQETKGARL